MWPVLDEPLVNRYFETLADLEQTVIERCRILNGDQLKPGTNFHWWPKPSVPKCPTVLVGTTLRGLARSHAPHGLQWQQATDTFGRAGGRELVAEFDGGRVTSEAGALLLGATDQAIRLV